MFVGYRKCLAYAKQNNINTWLDNMIIMAYCLCRCIFIGQG